MANLGLPKFQEEKAIAVATRFLSLSGGKCNKYWLNKLMYYVERESLVETGQPIFFDAMFSLPYGPIVSAVNDGIDSTQYQDGSEWKKNLVVDKKNVTLIKDGDYDLLSDFEEGIIRSAFEKFKGWGFDRLNSFFHNLPEHIETDSSIELPYSYVLTKSGVDKKTIDEAIEELLYVSRLESKLDCA